MKTGHPPPIDNQSQPRYVALMATIIDSLATFPRQTRTTVVAIDWARLAVPEARRLRELGFDEGAAVEVLHRARFGTGPVACRIGRMTVALRRTVAAAISVSKR